MNPTLDAVNQQTPRPANRKRLVQALVAIGALVAAMMGIIVVYGRKKATTAVMVTVQKVEPWEEVARKLKKETDFDTCKSALGTLTEQLRKDDSIPRAKNLGPDEQRALAAIVPLNAGDLEEIHNWNYSPHDPAYLTECFYLRDVAQSVKLPNLSPEQIADAGFAWVCRSVALSPWLFADRGGVTASALPPMYVLRRGFGSALERMYVYLALLQQLGLDGCLIGPPDAKEVGAYSALDAKRAELPGGPALPFWAVGVRIGSEIKLYDPWREEAFPSTLKSLKDKPEIHKDWFESKANLSGLKPDDVKKATIYLAAPVNALSPRMEMLDQKLLKENVGVRLAINPTTLRAAFPDPKPAFWNPPNDRFAYGRTARKFLPRERGGEDEAPQGARIYDVYLREQLPTDFKVNVPPQLRGDDARIANERLNQATTQIYAISFIDPPPTPRERIQRGQFQDALHDLIKKQDLFDKVLEKRRRSNDVAGEIEQWCEEARSLYAKLGRTALIADKDERARAIAEMQAAIDAHWKENAVELMISSVALPICKSEASFLIAYCKHEIAERAQTRADYAVGEDAAGLKQQAIEAWMDARAAWRTYNEGNVVALHNFPGRSSQIKVLSARAEKFAGMKP